MLTSACAVQQLSPAADIASFSLAASIPLQTKADRLIYDARNQRAFTLNLQDQEISIYALTGLKNVLGGLGSANANFQYVSDIALAGDGSLLVLDSAARLLRKFSAAGEALGSMELKGCVQPTLLALSAEQNLLVYDVAPAEIIVYSLLDGSEQYRFGRFELQQITSLFGNRDYLVAHSQATGQSRVYSSLGQFVRSDAGFTLFDAYNNAITYQNKMLKSLSGNAVLPLSDQLGQLTLDRDIIALTLDGQIQLFRINYVQEP